MNELNGSTHLRCWRCGATFAYAARFDGCPECAREQKRSPLLLAYGDSARAALSLRGDINATTSSSADAHGVWRWNTLLPPIPPNTRIHLGEGSTPLLRLPNPRPGLRLYLKNETQNPTWSWKDRANAVNISVARASGYKRVVAISTGNHGASVAAFAAAAGLHSRIYCHPGAPDLIVRLMRRYGAEVIRDSSDHAAKVREELSQGDVFPCVSLNAHEGFSNPFGIEGFKTIALELCEQMGRRAPDRVFIPVGSGDGIFGISQGFKELHAAGEIERLPQLVGCHSAAAPALSFALAADSHEVVTVPPGNTCALSVAEAFCGPHVIRAIKETNGHSAGIAESQIREAMIEIGAFGFALEPASSLTWAAAADAAPDSTAGETWVLIGSGAAPKWPESLT